MKTKTGIGIVLMVAILAISISFPSIASAQFAGRVPATIGLRGWSAHSLIHIRRAATAAPTGLSPTQIRAAYNLPSTGGQATIAIVDAYDDPTVLNDLNVFSSQFGLPSVTSANFEKHMMASRISVDSGWALEISLDVQWAHAIAPNAKILLVEATSNSLTALLAAVNYARNRPDVVAISMSWGGSEFSTESSYDSYFTSSYGACFFASSGDSGAGVLWPAASRNVVGVGGTTLNFAVDGSVASETAWSGSGGGISRYEAEPSYQVSYNVPGANGKRGVPDVSYDADPNSGVAVYDSTPYSGQSGWWQVGGTSAGAPQWAAIQSLGLSASNNNLYQAAKSSSYSSYFRDIASGSNGVYTATTGYDCVTGLGSPLTTNYAPVATPDFSISASPSTLTIQTGNSGSSTVTVTSLNGFSGTVSFVASAPPGLGADLSPSSLAVASGGSNSSTLSITAAPATAAGTYTVTVTVTSGSLSHSATVTVNVQTVTSAPQNLKATAGDAQVTLSWPAPSSDGGLAITGYNIYKGTASGGETLYTTIGNVLTYTDTAVTNGQTYYYEVTGVNTLGESGLSNEANATPSQPTMKILSVTVGTDKATYSRFSSVSITVTVKDSATGNPVQGASVKVTVYYPRGSVAWTGSGTTGPTGTVRFNYRVGWNPPKGTYKVVATASYTGYQTGIGQTTFDVL
jgi:subtilase family serine protease